MKKIKSHIEKHPFQFRLGLIIVVLVIIFLLDILEGEQTSDYLSGKKYIGYSESDYYLFVFVNNEFSVCDIVTEEVHSTGTYVLKRDGRLELRFITAESPFMVSVTYETEYDFEKEDKFSLQIGSEQIILEMAE